MLVALTNTRLIWRGKYIRGRSSCAPTTEAAAARKATRRELVCIAQINISAVVNSLASLFDLLISFILTRRGGF